MPKDPSKYRYFNVGILWDSETLADIEQDLKECHMEDQPSKLLALRIAEYYRLARKGFIFPGVSARMSVPAQVRSNGNHPASIPTYQQVPEDEEPSPQEEPNDKSDNVDDAADFWGM